MRTNLPVTNVEKLLDDNSLIVSKTDLKGRITYVNRDFIEISGFTKQELMGEPHNILRHPDMPVEAFQDLWDTLKQGRPWTGYVKNRCKNGDFYWVKANVAPIWEGGQIVSYLSARTKPERAVVEACENAYRQFREKRAKGLAIHNGQVVSNSLFARFFRKMRDLSLASKLMLSCTGLLAIAMILVSVILSANAYRSLEAEGTKELEDKLKFIRNTVDNTAQSAKKEASRQLEALTGQFAGNFSLLEGGEVPTLKSGSIVLNQRNEEIDRFATIAGASGTILVRKGDDFVRIATTNKDSSGKRLIGAALGLQHPATAQLLAGNLYIGRTVVAGRDRYSAFAPIKDAQGKVIGAFGTGHDFSEAVDHLKQLIKSVKAGKTGYFFVLDATPGKDYGKLVVHPAKEGTNISEAEDSSGGKFIKEMLEKKQGRIIYPWINKELGDTAPRNKIAVYDQYSEWNWLIGGGTNLDEFDEVARALQRSLMLASLIVVVVLAILIVWLMRRKLRTPLQEVLQIFYRIAGGDFRSSIDLAKNDEIGKVLQGLQAMQTRMGFEMAETKRQAEKSARVMMALENVSTGVMIADTSRTILYANKTAHRILKNAEADIRTQLPTFSADHLAGQNIDTFHKNPAHQARLLAEITTTYTANLEIGGHFMTVIANPVIDAKGERLGSVAEWKDRTAEVLVEREAAGIVEAAANGDFSRRFQLQGKEGFFLQLGEQMNRLLDNSERGLNEVVQVMGALAKGDLTRRMNGDFAGTFGQLKQDVDATIDNLQEIIGSIQHATEAINTAAREIAAGNTDLSARTEEQASSLEETASSMEELSSTVKHNADNARLANEQASEAQEVASRGGEVVGQVVQTMGAIHQSSSKIADIIGVIDGIAFQTNILALNAAVEAARAGEQGRGFAVVATEVRNLAQRSAAAAKEIKSLISDSVDKVDTGNRLVATAGETMEEVVNSIQRVARIVTDISAASREQSSGIEQVSLAVSQMDEVTQQNAALVEEAAAAAESLEDQAQQLAQAVAVFRLAGQAPAFSARPQASQVSQPTRRRLGGKKPAALPASLDDEWQEF